MTAPRDPDAMLAGFRQQIEDKLQRADQLKQAASEIRGTASSEDGGVTVAVDQGGCLTQLDLTDRAMRQRPEELSAAILDTVRSAQSTLTEQMRAAVEPLLGSDAETLEAVLQGTRERFPEESAQARPSAEPAADDEDFSGDSWLEGGGR
ncbi:YbaB/EbfC family nucleoid-associated protein [Salinifilum ghardaiensis]